MVFKEFVMITHIESSDEICIHSTSDSEHELEAEAKKIRSQFDSIHIFEIRSTVLKK